MMIVEQSVEDKLAEKTKILGESLPQCHFVNHKIHMTPHGARTHAAAWEAGD
jgi:hypothetical protein